MKYDKRELAQIVQRELDQALGAPDSEIAHIRLRNLQYYKAEAIGELAGPSIDDRSSIVASDVADTIEWMMPSLLRPFATSQDAMELEARRPEKSQVAKLATEYLKLIFWKRNRGFNVLYNWFKDALIQKVGFVKVVWEDYKEDTEDVYTGLLATQVQDLLNTKGMQIIEREDYTEVIDGQPIQLYNVKVKCQIDKGRCKVMPCPPEEMRVHSRSRYGEKLDFIAHVFYKTKQDLEADGHDLAGISPDEGQDMEQTERMSSQSSYGFESSDGELARYKVSECYIRLDQDGDGVAECLRVLMIGQTIVEQSRVDDHPFVYFCPIPMPHVFFGNCPADQAIDPQRLRTSLMRAIADNVYLTVNKRIEVVEDMVDIDDLLNSRPGGLVRVKALGQMQPINQGALDASAWQLMEWSEKWNEQRTGFTQYSKGLTSDSLNPTATGVLTITEKGDQRTELMARVAAETAVRILFEKMLKCICKYQQKSEQVELFGQWIDIDPREWVDAFNVSVNIGLGTGSKDKIAQIMQVVMQIQQQFVQGGVIPPQAAVLAARKYAESAGITSPETYFPDAMPPQNQPDPAQMKAQADIAILQAQAQIDMQRDAARFQAESMVAQRDAELQAQVDMNRQEQEARQKALDNQQKMDIESYKAELTQQNQQQQREFDRQMELERIQSAERIAFAREFKDMMPQAAEEPAESTEAQPDPTQALAQVMADSSAQNNQMFAQMTAMLAQAMTAPKTATLSNGRTITVRTNTSGA